MNAIDQPRAVAIPTAEAALFLDLDGTLAPIAQHPGHVRPDLARSDLLRRAVEALEGRVAIISGRSIAEVDRILEGCAACVAGVHGLERRTAEGAVHAAKPHVGLERAREAFQAVSRARAGLFLEEKTLGLALHYRNAPGAADAVRDVAQRLARTTGLTLQEGDMVAELTTPGADKGVAVHAFMTEPPFRGARPIFIGDDLTDEHGFAAASALGGVGILVGDRAQTNAIGRLADPGAVSRWIESALESGCFIVEPGR